MLGSTGSTYKVVFETENTLVGTRDLGDGTTRVRVNLKPGGKVDTESFKPVNTFNTWKFPGYGQNRYSTVVSNANVFDALLEAFSASIPEESVEESLSFFGPGGTEYARVFQNTTGRVGVAALGDELHRVRVEPVSGTLNLNTWQQPYAGNLRYSKVVKTADLAQAVATAINALL